MAPTSDQLRPFWQLVDATVLDQPKRMATQRARLVERVRTDPDEALTAMAELAALAVAVAADARNRHLHGRTHPRHHQPTCSQAGSIPGVASVNLLVTGS